MLNQIQGSEKVISILVSGARIIATIGIFSFHFLGRYEINNRYLDIFSILIFCFLTGYLSFGVKKNRFQWLKDRVLSVMIPYWIVILPVLVINRIISYKNTTLIGDFITFWGGNMFLEKKVYVIAWYITFILIIYLFIYFQSFTKNIIIRILIWVIGFGIFSMWLHKEYYFLSVGLGFLLSKYFPPPAKEVTNKRFVLKILFSIQGYCYFFFLVHGGILLFIFNFLSINMFYSFFYGLSLSIFAAIIVKRMNAFLKNCIAERRLLS